MKSIKAVKLNHKPTPQTGGLLETFLMMVNDAIRICLAENVSGRLNLRNRIYREFRDRYEVVSCYPCSVAEVAWSIVKKHRRWQRRPFADHLMMKLDVRSFSFNYAILSLPLKKGNRILVPLGYGAYQRSFLADNTLKRGSAMMTDSTVVITFTKETEVIKPLTKVGYDLNEKSVVASDGMRYDLSEIARLHTEYGLRRRHFYSRYPHDGRLKLKFSSHSREKNRVKQFFNRVSNAIVDKAKKSREAIVLERQKGIRYASMRRNGKGKASRRRIALLALPTTSTPN